MRMRYQYVWRPYTEYRETGFVAINDWICGYTTDNTQDNAVYSENNYFTSGIGLSPVHARTYDSKQPHNSITPHLISETEEGYWIGCGEGYDMDPADHRKDMIMKYMPPITGKVVFSGGTHTTWDIHYRCKIEGQPFRTCPSGSEDQILKTCWLAEGNREQRPHLGRRDLGVFLLWPQGSEVKQLCLQV